MHSFMESSNMLWVLLHTHTHTLVLVLVLPLPTRWLCGPHLGVEPSGNTKTNGSAGDSPTDPSPTMTP